MAEIINVELEQESILETASELTTTISISDEIKQALLQCFSHVAWVDDEGQTYYDALYDALYPPVDLSSISCVYTQSGTVYDTDSLDSLKSDLVVTAHYSDQSTETVTTYTLSGTLTEGTSTITVTYMGKTTSFNVTVTENPSLYRELSYIQPSGEAYVNINYIPTQNTKIVMDYMNIKPSGDSFQCPIGAVQSTTQTADGKVFYFYIGSSNNLVANVCRGGGQGGGGATIAKDSRNVYSLSNSDISVDSVSYGKPRSSASMTDTLNASVGFTFYVFARNHGDTLVRAYATGKLYELSIYENDVLVRHYVPRQRKSDDVCGLLETINDVFYIGSGSGSIVGAV